MPREVCEKEIARLDSMNKNKDGVVMGDSSKYRDEIKALWGNVRQLATPKTIGKLRMTGPALAKLVEKWTENMNVPIGNYRSNSAEVLLEHIM